MIEAAGADLTVLHTPGHAPGAVFLYDPGLGTVFTGDTLFQGGPEPPGAPSPTSRRSSSRSASACSPSRPTRSSAPGTGSSTTIGAEAPHLEEWIKRGH